MIYLNIADAKSPTLVIDSSAIVDGAFEMSGKVKSLDINFFSVQNIPGTFLLFSNQVTSEFLIKTA